MSVIIKDMDVPKCCGECPFLEGYLNTWCWISEKKLYKDRIKLQFERHKDCPIVKVEQERKKKKILYFILGILLVLFVRKGEKHGKN